MRFGSKKERCLTNGTKWDWSRGRTIPPKKASAQGHPLQCWWHAGELNLLETVYKICEWCTQWQEATYQVWEQDIGESVTSAAEAAAVNAAVQEGCHPTINTYQNMCPKGLNNCMLCCAIIVSALFYGLFQTFTLPIQTLLTFNFPTYDFTIHDSHMT